MRFTLVLLALLAALATIPATQFTQPDTARQVAGGGVGTGGTGDFS